MQVAGTWSENLQKQHINYLEMMAVFLGLKHFVKHLENKVVLVKTDNTTVMCYINKQGGGGSIPKSVHFDLEYVSVGNKTQDSLDSATRIGSEQLFSRSTIKGVENKEHGVDFEKVCGPNNFSDVGNSTCRPICHSTESPNSNICIPISRRISPDSGCSVDQLEGCDRLCIPSHCSNSQSPAENSGRGLQDNSHCTILDKTTLVSNFNTVTGRLPCETTRDQRSDKSTQKQVVSSKRKHVKADSMEIISRQLVKKGFSRSVSKRAASCRRASTYSTYNNRLRVFLTGPDENILIRCRHLNHR